MQTKLTKKQQEQISIYRQRYFDRAVCTDAADRERAEVAARKIAEIDGVKIANIIWVNNPDDGKAVYDKECASLSDSLRASLWDSLRASLRASLSDSLWASLRASLSDSLWASLWDSLWASLRASLWDSLRDSLWASLSDSLWASLRASLWDSLRASLRDSLWDSLSDSLWDSLWASLWDTPIDAYYTYCEEVLGIGYDAKYARLLRLYNDLGESCFAFWLVPGAAILCERPAKCEIKNGRLIDIEWRG